VRWEGHVARKEWNISAYKVVVGTHEEKKQLGRAWSKWEDNIQIDLK
jgi:hypothetical protein